MKKVFVLSVTLVMAAALFAGCGGKEGGETAASSSPVVTTTQATATSSVPATSSAPATTSAAPVTSTAPKTTTAPATSTPAATTAASSTPAASGNDLATLLAKAAVYPSFYFEVKVTSPDGVSNMKEWFKTGNPAKFRMEITAAGQTSLMIFDGQNYYLYDSTTKSAIKMSVPPSQPSDSSSIAQYTPVYIGSEVVNGIDCAIYQYTVQGVITKMWISKQNGMTIKVVSGTTTMEYSNYSFAAIADAMFALPPDAIIMTIPGM